MHYWLFLFFLLPATTVWAVPLNSIQALLPQGSQLALSVYDTKQHRSIVTVDDNILLPPASTQKMVTALAASLLLPPDFRFKTDMLLTGDNLVIKFGGDPTLMRSDLRKLINTLATKKITHIKGDIWLDGSIFSGYERAVGWPWDNLGVCYSAPASAITLEKNCVQGSIYSEFGKKLTRTFVPKHQPVTVETNAIVVTKDQQKQTLCQLELRYDDNNNYTLSGCLAARKGPLPLKFAVQNPAKYMAGVLQDMLEAAHIKLDGQIKIGTAPKIKGAKLQVIASHQSEKRDILLRKMLKRSDNLIADNLVKMIGHHYYRQPGSFVNGTAAMKKIIQQQTNIDLTTAVLVDGSGLSRNNRMTATQLMDVMKWAHTHPNLGLMEMLPISGVDGTLKYRRSVRQAPIREKLKAKTGSLFGSYNLAGVIENKLGRDILVVQMVTNYHIPKTEEPVTTNVTPISQFEHELYQALLSSTLTANFASHNRQ